YQRESEALEALLSASSEPLAAEGFAIADHRDPSAHRWSYLFTKEFTGDFGVAHIHIRIDWAQPPFMSEPAPQALTWTVAVRGKGKILFGQRQLGPQE